MIHTQDISERHASGKALIQNQEVILNRMNIQRSIRKTRKKFDYYISRVTKLQELIALEEKQISQCLAEERQLLNLLREHQGN